MAVRTLETLKATEGLAGKRVLIRCDLNVPMQNGRVTDPTRIRAHLPTLKAVLAEGGIPIVLAHFGRPKGQAMPTLSLRSLAEPLAAELGAPVTFVPSCIGPRVTAAIEERAPGAVLLLENTRFHPGEEANDCDFAAEIAGNGDLFVNDAFSAAHRAHASTETLARLLPSAAGLAMQAEIDALDAALGAPERPVMALVGGAKVSTKLDLLGNLVAKVDTLAIGGGMANTFLVAKAMPIGRSLAEPDMADTARAILEQAASANCEILLPRDIVVAGALTPGADTQTLPAAACPEDQMILDAGPETVAAMARRLEAAKTLVWNGPLGAFEVPPFDAATKAAAEVAAELTAAGKLLSVAGGGDTVAALNAAGVADRFSYLSTAGGAFLEWLEGKSLPGVAALSD